MPLWKEVRGQHRAKTGRPNRQYGSINRTRSSQMPTNRARRLQNIYVKMPIVPPPIIQIGSPFWTRVEPAFTFRHWRHRTSPLWNQFCVAKKHLFILYECLEAFSSYCVYFILPFPYFNTATALSLFYCVLFHFKFAPILSYTPSFTFAQQLKQRRNWSNLTSTQQVITITRFSNLTFFFTFTWSCYIQPSVPLRWELGKNVSVVFPFYVLRLLF